MFLLPTIIVPLLYRSKWTDQNALVRHQLAAAFPGYTVP